VRAGRQSAHQPLIPQGKIPAWRGRPAAGSSADGKHYP